MTIPYLKLVALDGTKEEPERMTALLLLVIVCFVSPIWEDNVVHEYLVQFVEDMDTVNSYSWGAACLTILYIGIEKYKLKSKKRVDGNCRPLLVWHIFASQYKIIIYLYILFVFSVAGFFFCTRIPKLSRNLGFEIDLENQNAPLLNYCMIRNTDGRDYP